MIDIDKYWIPEISQILEFSLIAQTENIELQGFWGEIDNMYLDQAVMTATENGIIRYESMLEIIPFADDTVSSRRFRILARMNEQLPYSYRMLIQRLNLLCGVDEYTISMDTDNYKLTVLLELVNKRMFDEVLYLLKEIVPANMIIDVQLRYNQHQQLTPFTHQQLTKFTHKQLREEVFN